MRSKQTLFALLVGLAALSIAPAALAEESSLDASLSSAIDPEHGLRVEDAARRAVDTSPDVQARNEAREAAEAARAQAALDFVPRITTTAKYVRLSPLEQSSAGTLVVAPTAPAGPIAPGTQLVNAQLSFPVLLNQTSAQAQLTIPVSDYLLRLTQKYSAAKETEEAARLQVEASKLVVATNARIAYYDWIRTRMQVVVADKSLATAKQHVTDAQSGLSVGTGSKADVLRAESQVASSELLLARAQNAQAKAEDRLRTAMHDDKADLRAIGEDVRVDPPSFDVAGGIEALVSEAAQKRREIRAIGHTAESLRQQASATRALYLPRLDAVGEVTYANPNQRIFPQSDEFRATWSVGLVLTWSPNDALAGGPATRAADAKEAEARAQKRALADQLRMEVVESFRALEEMNVALSSARRGVAAAEEGHRVRLALYQAGRATGTELTDAENELVRSRFELVNAYIDARLARVRLAHAVGRD